MIIKSSEWVTATEIRSDIAIIGSGAAGLSLALALESKNRHLKIVVLEGGDQNFTSTSQDIYRGEFSARDLPYGLQNSRLRFFGGSTNCWAGGCGRLDEEDFHVRPWVNNSGWPINLSDLESHYGEAGRFLDVTGTREEREGAIIRSGIPDLTNFETSSLEYTKKTRFATEFRHKLERSKQVDILLDANFTGIERDPQSGVVMTIQIQPVKGPTRVLKSKIFVFAAGGIENARLLLNTQSGEMPALGDRSGNLGSWFCDHPIAPSASLVDDSGLKQESEFEVRQLMGLSAQGSNMILPFYRLPYSTQKEFETLNVSLQVHKQENPLTAVEVAAWRLKKYVDKPTDYTLNLGDILSVASSPRTVYRTYKNRQTGTGRLAVRVQMEQEPKRSNRVSLTNKTDALGLRRASLHWEFSDLERRTMDVALAYAADGFQKLGHATLCLDPQVYENKRELPADLRGGQHHCGTTRMASREREGVVDSNLKLFDCPNTFICGSSVFPTNGWVNPTMTIIALSFRLAGHLTSKLASQ